MQGSPTLISLTYTESHPDKCRTFIGIYSTEELARKAMQNHMSAEKQRLPCASISEWNYSFHEAELDCNWITWAEARALAW